MCTGKASSEAQSQDEQVWAENNDEGGDDSNIYRVLPLV